MKTVIAPFSAISLMLFLLFLFNKILENFNSDNYFSRQEIVKSLLTMFGAGGLVAAAIWGLQQSPTFDKVIFYLSILVSIVFFLSFRIRNLISLSIITGMAEGTILYIVFFS